MRALALLFFVILTCAGCGYRGPLYLPQSKPAAQPPQAPAVTPPPERPATSEAAPAPK